MPHQLLTRLLMIAGMICLAWACVTLYRADTPELHRRGIVILIVATVLYVSGRLVTIFRSHR